MIDKESRDPLIQLLYIYLWLQRKLSCFLRKERMCKTPWCPYWFKIILDASYHIYFYQNQQIIRYPCKTKAFCPFFHFIKHISFSCTTLLVLWYSRLGPSSRLLPKIWRKFWFLKNVPLDWFISNPLGFKLYLCSNCLMFFLLIFFILKHSALLCTMYQIM